MWQSAWELDWDKMKGLYNFRFSVLAYIMDDAILDQWSPMASAIGTQSWTDSDADDTLYSHVVLLLLSPLKLLDLVKGKEQDRQNLQSCGKTLST